MTDLEARARELARTILPATGLYPEEMQENRRTRYMPDILAFARSVAADAREEALNQALVSVLATTQTAAQRYGTRQACVDAIRALLRTEPRDG